MIRRWSIFAVVIALTSAAIAESYVGVSGGLVLPQGGSRARRLGGATFRAGHYLTDNLALEGEAAWLEDSAGLAVNGLWHLQGFDLYGDFFGYSQIDPFITMGARGFIGGANGQVGPKVGFGTYYHLTDKWALRADADAMLGLDTRNEMLYTISAGVQYSF